MADRIVLNTISYHGHGAIENIVPELTNPDGTMARLPEIMAFSQLHDMPVLQVRDLIEYMEH